jgi:transglutaminase-like putative cysteine protease
MRILGIGFLLCLTAISVSAAGDDVPTWVQQAASMKYPTYDKDVPAVVLVSEGIKSVDADGRVSEVRNFAVRILSREGREYAFARVGYVPDVGKVKELHAWLIRAGGEVKRYGKDDTVDVAGAPNDVYNEYRSKGISASNDADAGTVFAYSYTLEDRSVFSQDDWAFQSGIPVISSRYVLSLPVGWRAESVTFNHAPIQPSVSGSTYTWELSNLQPISDEPLSPSLDNLVARLAVSYFPPSSVQTTAIRTFSNWGEVAAWMSELEDPQVLVDDALARKSYELTALAKTELEKIQAIAQYVQKIQYISIQTGLGRGGGYRPHSSTEVFAKSYGDCKDKANLMRAMLKVIGIASLPVSIYSGDPDYVRPDWPSPQQFNHCIIAVKVTDQTSGNTVIQDPTFGRLLIFDPTDGDTPLGDLPSYLQGSLALIDSRDSKDLVQMPVTPPDTNRLERKADLELTADGAITGTIQEQAQGQTAALYRTEFRRLSRPEYTAMIERWVTRGAAAARLAKIEPTDSPVEGRFSLRLEFTAKNYGQLMQDRLLIFKPVVVARREGLSLTSSQRKYPVVLHGNAYNETVHIKLPAGFDVDELPATLNMDTSFGSYKTSYEVQNGELIFKRALSQRASTIPVEKYDVVRKFFESIRDAEQAPVVLARQ